ncbi:MAG TPA: DUF4357 domain-containing protein [Bryobacteraceae bacterium]|jgi:hypothetical protein|nr:DUF4357 domain-containing protein [Bryobacteraceae bacterium]
MDAFLDDMLLILPVVGLNAFETPQPSLAPQNKLKLKGKGTSGIGYETESGFVVLAGSEMRPDSVESMQAYLDTLRNSLVTKQIVAKVNGSLRFAQDYTFDSPSTAAGVLLGRSANGRVEWKDDAGRTLKQIQIGDVAAKAAGSS